MTSLALVLLYAGTPDPSPVVCPALALLYASVPNPSHVTLQLSETIVYSRTDYKLKYIDMLRTWQSQTSTSALYTLPQ
jgi:hypothetical protein